MRIVMTLLCAAALAVGSMAGCDKKAEGGEAAEKKAAPVKPFEGQLTGKLLEDAKAKVKPFMPWDEADAALLGAVGKPTKVEGADHYWAVVEGDKCTELKVEKTAKGEVGMTGVSTIDKAMTSMFDKCAARVGGGAAAEQK